MMYSIKINLKLIKLYVNIQIKLYWVILEVSCLSYGMVRCPGVSLGYSYLDKTYSIFLMVIFDFMTHSMKINLIWFKNIIKIDQLKVFLSVFMCPGLSWGILGCPGVIRLTQFWVDLAQCLHCYSRFNFALNISDKTCLANLNFRFLWGFKAQFESNISLHSLINILSRQSLLLSGEMNGVSQGRKKIYNSTITSIFIRSRSTIILF